MFNRPECKWTKWRIFFWGGTSERSNYSNDSLIYLIFNRIPSAAESSDNQINTHSETTHWAICLEIHSMQTKPNEIYSDYRANRLRHGAWGGRRTNESSWPAQPKILCDFHSLHSYFYWNSLMSGSPQRNYWIFVCSNLSRMRLRCCSDRWNYVAHSNKMCEMKKKMEYDQSGSRNTQSLSHTRANTKPTRMFALYVSSFLSAHFHSVSLWTFNACFIIHFVSFTAGRSSIGQQRSVSFGSLNSWNCKIVSNQTCGSMILINFLDSLCSFFG